MRLVLLDDRSADEDDGRIINTIRESGPPDLRIALLSGRAFTFDIERYLKKGVDRCVSKPVPLKKLGHICRELISRKLTDSGALDAQALREQMEKKKSHSLLH